jgi:hypothetical protein
MKKVKVVRVKTAMEFINAMKKHRCSDKMLAPMDDDLGKVSSLGYACIGCNRFRVLFALGDLYAEEKRLKLFWKTIRTSNGRSNLGEALLVGRIPGL